METLDAPIYEIKQESDWYKTEKKRREDINKFFDEFEATYGIKNGFSFYHSEYFEYAQEQKHMTSLKMKW